MKKSGSSSLRTPAPRLSPLVLALLLPASSWAGGVVTVLDETHLRAALAGGGSVTFAVDGTAYLGSTIIISEDSILDASGHSVTISGGNVVRLFQVNPGVVFQVRGLTLANGRFLGADGSNGYPGPYALPQAGLGAGIFNQSGSVSLVQCTLANHFVRGGAGGANVLGGSTQDGADGMGAALYNLGGQVSLTNCLLSGNCARGGPGGTSRSGAVGASGSGLGGAIFSSGGSLTLSGVILQNNSAYGAPASASVGVTSGYGGLGGGGAVYAENCSFYAEYSVWAGNSAVGGEATGQSPIAAGSARGGALVATSAELRRCGFSGNSAVAPGPTYSGNAGVAAAGAVYVTSLLQVWDSTFASNTARAGSGTPLAGTALGGALFSSGSCRLAGCSSYNNLAQVLDAYMFSGPSKGGALCCVGGTLAATNSTWALNAAVASAAGANSASGGGLFLDSATATLVNVTIASNQADAGSLLRCLGGNLSSTNSSITLLNSIVANNVKGGDVRGPVNDDGYNLCSDGTANFSAVGSLNQTNPLLASLADNGGPTLTLGLNLGSPARDAIPAGYPPADQRGVTRPQGAAADIGAFEAELFYGMPPIINSPPQTQTAERGATADFQVSSLGYPPLTYDWLFNGTSLHALSSSFCLRLTNIQPSQAGAYAVRVANPFGAVTSSPAMLSVIAPVARKTVPAIAVTGDIGSFVHLIHADVPAPGDWWQEFAAATLTNPPQLCLDLSEPLPAARFYRAWQTNSPSVSPALQMKLATELSLSGAIGDKLRVDYINQFGPTDAWLTLDTVTLTNTSQPYFDLGMFHQPTRLYRLVPVP